MASKKGVGSTRNGRDSEAKRLGVKRFGGESVLAGSRGLGGGNGRLGNDVHPADMAIELHPAGFKRVERPVASHADILAGDEFGAALADEDGARGDELAAEALHTQTFAMAVTTVA